MERRKRRSDSCAVFAPAAGDTKQESVIKARMNNNAEDRLMTYKSMTSRDH